MGWVGLFCSRFHSFIFLFCLFKPVWFMHRLIEGIRNIEIGLSSKEYYTKIFEDFSSIYSFKFLNKEEKVSLAEFLQTKEDFDYYRNSKLFSLNREERFIYICLYTIKKRNTYKKVYIRKLGINEFRCTGIDYTRIENLHE